MVVVAGAVCVCSGKRRNGEIPRGKCTFEINDPLALYFSLSLIFKETIVCARGGSFFVCVCVPRYCCARIIATIRIYADKVHKLDVEYAAKSKCGKIFNWWWW